MALCLLSEKQKQFCDGLKERSLICHLFLFIYDIIFLQVVGCVATAIGAANDCYPCVCDAVEWTCGCDVC